MGKKKQSTPQMDDRVQTRMAVLMDQFAKELGDEFSNLPLTRQQSVLVRIVEGAHNEHKLYKHRVVAGLKALGLRASDRIIFSQSDNPERLIALNELLRAKEAAKEAWLLANQANTLISLLAD
jgi:hypothetical protein